MLEDLKKLLSTEEGQKQADLYWGKVRKRREIKESQLEKSYKYNDRFSEIVDKIILKYDSDKYVNFWYKKGIMPPEPLKFFIYEYSEKYGRECTVEECQKYGNCFTSGIYFINGYYVSRMDGQGSVIEIFKL